MNLYSFWITIRLYHEELCIKFFKYFDLVKKKMHRY